jgi:hypothetical protein
MSELDVVRPDRRTHSRRGTPLREIARKKRRRDRSVPPPFPFDIGTLPDSTLLAEAEVSAIIRRTPPCLQNWRKYPDHPLRWRRVGGRILYELGSVREFLKGDANDRRANPKTQQKNQQDTGTGK